MAGNRGVAYVEPGKVELKPIPYPKLKMPASESDPFGGKDAPHGVILKILTTNICGSDQHMVRGRTTAPRGLILGHEITGEVIEKGVDVEFLYRAGKNAEPCLPRRLGARIEEPLQAEADSQKRHVAFDAGNQSFTNVHFVERTQHLPEVSDTRQNNL